MTEHPVISVVTVSFNAVDCIEKTILSVISQNCSDFEYVIMDGGSTDGTQSVVERYSDRIDLFESEPDGGIYYGMNRGIEAVAGDYVIFMNCGDCFCDNGVLSDVVSFLRGNPDCDVAYGNSVQQYEYGRYTVVPREAYINHRMSISHQAAFVRRGLLLEHKFDVRYKYAADFEQLSYFYLSGRKFLHIDRQISLADMTDGATFRHFEESANEMYDIIAARGFDVRKERISQIRRKKIVRMLKSVLPSFIRVPLFRFVAKYYKAL